MFVQRCPSWISSACDSFAHVNLDKIPTALKKVTNYVPLKVDGYLRDAVRTFMKSLDSTTTARVSSGRLTEKDSAFAYQAKNYELTVVEGGAAQGATTGGPSITQLKIVHKSEAGKVHVFEAADFETGVEKTKYDAVMAAATTLQKAAVAQSQVATTKSAKTPGKVAPKPKGVFQNLLALQQTLTDAVAALKLHLQALGCKYLNAGCFAAGTPLWTPGGYRAIETLVPGELVYSRDEWNPTGDIEAKVIEEVFARYAGVYQSASRRASHRHERGASVLRGGPGLDGNARTASGRPGAVCRWQHRASRGSVRHRRVAVGVQPAGRGSPHVLRGGRKLGVVRLGA